jgi:hypothetical protein
MKPMNKQNLFLMMAMLLIGSLVQAATEDYEELSYNDLVNQLAKKKSVVQTSAELSSEKSYLVRVGFSNSFAKVNSSSARYDVSQGGVLIGVAADLDQKKWFTEGVFKNYSSIDHPGITTSFRELEARLGLQSHLNQKYGMRAFVGANFRFLDTKEVANKKTDSLLTPSMAVGMNGDMMLNPIFSIGTEVIYRSPLSATADLGSWDFSLYSGFRF